MSDPNATTSSAIVVDADGISSISDAEPVATGVLGLVRACQATARLVCARDSLAYEELVEALALAEISALRLMAEEAHIGSC